ncbi:polysaccharide pyruvyl transferase family protein [Opitutus terrae]|uniref:Polysaccharide pyruvyl transferase domain-containing protein n=1 Tax=Opitutus terrae (strain DSM 11246 / JCM 15787 / PB90-1) TaxID=452637 RepID=B1ZSZ6_OPITP|nr:polysaccharide pyruvyl transferase family protein [Opitutus terrae]ACB75785.1 hypothetical protein Oter_2503 [Opitutus terrae PB90-1]
MPFASLAFPYSLWYFARRAGSGDIAPTPARDLERGDRGIDASPAAGPAHARGGLPPAAFDELRETLRAVSGRRITLLVNRGNRGDGVIHLGGRQLLRSLDLRWTEVYEPRAPEKIQADVLLVFGNGAFCRATHSLIPIVQRYADQVSRVIILPASFDLRCPAVRTFAASWDDRYTVFCRERRSFGDLEAAGVRPRRLALSHDLAFLADLGRWARRPHSGTSGIFRRDGEAVFDWRPRHLPGTDVSRGPDSESHVLLDYVARHAVVHTDRTHAAITAAMMGREVWLYRNAYFKNEAIYEHSLVHWPRVHFVGRLPFSFRQLVRSLYFHHLQRRAYKLRRRYRGWKELKRRGASAGRR